jgi:glutamine synthetase
MLGSSLSIAGPNFVLNTIVAESLRQFADKLEKAKDFTAELNALIRENIKEHKRIIFNGNGYDNSWVLEAEKRGLSNLKTVPEALDSFITPKSIDVLTKHGVLSKVEIHSRYEIVLESYCKTLSIVVLTMLDMIKKDILPATFAYIKDVSGTALVVKQLVPDAALQVETDIVAKLSCLADVLAQKTAALEKAHLAAQGIDEAPAAARAYAKSVVPAMQEARAVADEIEPLLGEDYLPFPTYADLLFSV